uniref:probable inactive ATP-dependent zinc metalloprotease FTSHI 3, chloroplastic n=1 Tax=Erigeron canadensis TaxID=72917 RepID=UPI001CB93CAD|nr:probable inactive ATP-dependent zinc metalloprotease FTSHI 3, chloroplastic [Erigeron canadensis]
MAAAYYSFASTSSIIIPTRTTTNPLSACSPLVKPNTLSKSPIIKRKGPPSSSLNLLATSCNILRGKGSRAQMGSVQHDYDSVGWFGKYGGNKYVPESLMSALAEIQSASKAIFTTDHECQQNSTTMHLGNIIKETKDYRIVFKGISEAIKQKPEVLKGPLADVLSKRSLTWGSVSTSLLLVYEQTVKSRKERPEEISFDDLVGLKDAKADVKLILETLKGDRQFVEFGEKSPGGVLICGPEGTGKETLANAIAYEANVPFFNVSAEEITRDGATKGIATIISLFLVARIYPRCLIYIKDIDAIDGKQTTSKPGPILLQLLTDMEKCNKDGHMAIVIGGTTKEPELLDPKLRNSELFLREVRVDKPDKDAREGFIDLYLTKYTTQENKKEICTLIVSETEGLVRNHISRVCKLSKQNAYEKDGKYVTTANVIEALKTVKASITTSMAQQKQLTKDGEYGNKVNILEAPN